MLADPIAQAPVATAAAPPTGAAGGSPRRLVRAVFALRPMTSRRFAGLVVAGALPLVGFTVGLIAVGPAGAARYWLDAARSCCGWLYAGWMGYLLQARFRQLPRGQEFALRIFRLAEEIRKEGARSAGWIAQEGMEVANIDGALQRGVLALFEEGAFLELDFPEGCIGAVLKHLTVAGIQGSAPRGNRHRAREEMFEAADTLQAACDWVRR